MKDFPVYLGLGLFALIGLGIFSLGARNLWRAAASYRWPSAPAKVVESSLETTVESSRSTDSDEDSPSTMYIPTIRFQYEVNGHTYTTEQIYIGQTAGSGDSSEAELRRFRYPMGADVSVVYSPADPSIGSVHRGFQEEVLWLPGAGLAFLVPALMGLILFRSMFQGASGFGAGLMIFSLIFVTLGGVFLFVGGRAVWRGWKSTGWPSAPGVIVYGPRDPNVKSTQAEAGDSISTSTASGSHVIYRFEVNGRPHYSNTRRFGQLAGSSDAGWSSEIAARYPVGRRVTVWHRPDDPDLATLEPGVAKEAFWAPGAGAAFFLFGLAALLFGVPALSRSF